MSVGLYVASFNTLALTRDCVESVLALTPPPLELTVGDSGSQDGSLEWLRAQEAAGRLRLQVEPEPRTHAWWLDTWVAESPHELAVFLDSDVVVRDPAWLERLVARAERTGAAIVAGEMCPEQRNFVEPVGHATVRLARRPAPWLLLVRPQAIRGLGCSFAFAAEKTDSVPEGQIAYDVGGLLHRRALAAGLRVETMGRRYRRCYRHLAGGSWRR